MQYLGGKSRDAKRLAAVIDNYRQPGRLVWDPFCGGLSMAVALSANGPVFASDIHRPLISLYQCVRAGWVPPTELTEAQYRAARALPDWHPRKAFAGFGCSFSGKWFGGYARGKINYARAAHNILLRDAQKAWRLRRLDFLAVRPRPTRAILYLDPPYRGTTGYSGTPEFDYSLFLRCVQGWAEHTLVFVSEHPGFPLGGRIWSAEKTRAKLAKPGAVDCLYLVGGE